MLSHLLLNQGSTNFQKEWCTFGRKKMMFEKNKNCPLSRFECFEHVKKIKFVSSFEHVNFAINGRYSKRNYNNSNYCVSLVIFQAYKNAILKNVHSLGWLLDFTHWLYNFKILILSFFGIFKI